MTMVLQGANLQMLREQRDIKFNLGSTKIHLEEQQENNSGSQEKRVKKGAGSCKNFAIPDWDYLYTFHFRLKLHLMALFDVGQWGSGKTTDDLNTQLFGNGVFSLKNNTKRKKLSESSLFGTVEHYNFFYILFGGGAWGYIAFFTILGCL